ncbi:hypothetical protein P3X46_010479 [Hevea brasiliensis]|uniref:Uncharacterized protein n=1 Tax=Hevea brasiliensis TaxID=3981 RepID=A0ABQ9ME67_HEVBR|nr:hypothetical protein P3X46_010479 [Hevea brasiliensis]
MPYPPCFPSFHLYPIYPPQQFPQSSLTTMGTQNPMEGVTREQVPPPAAPIVLTQETWTSGRNKLKMTNYLKLDAPKYKEGDDLFKYVKAIKMIANELDTSDSRAIQIVGFILKCKKAKEWYKTMLLTRSTG